MNSENHGGYGKKEKGGRGVVYDYGSCYEERDYILSMTIQA